LPIRVAIILAKSVWPVKPRGLLASVEGRKDGLLQPLVGNFPDAAAATALARRGFAPPAGTSDVSPRDVLLFGHAAWGSVASQTLPLQ